MNTLGLGAFIAPTDHGLVFLPVGEPILFTLYEANGLFIAQVLGAAWLLRRFL